MPTESAARSEASGALNVLISQSFRPLSSAISFPLHKTASQEVVRKGRREVRPAVWTMRYSRSGFNRNIHAEACLLPGVDTIGAMRDTALSSALSRQSLVIVFVSELCGEYCVAIVYPCSLFCPNPFFAQMTLSTSTRIT